MKREEKKSKLEKIGETISVDSLEKLGYKYERQIHNDMEVYTNHDSYLIIRDDLGDDYSVYNKFYKKGL